MLPWLLVPLFGAALATAAAEECADLPLCARIATPKRVFFAGEAIAERQREGHKPEYRFAVREILLGLPSGTETVIVETSEGTPPSGTLLVEAQLLDDGTFARADCDYVADGNAASEAIATLRQLRLANASLAVNAADFRGGSPDGARIVVDGPMQRLADRHARFADLAPGVYRISVTAPGYQDTGRQTELQPGSCPTIDIRLVGMGEITGTIQAGETIRAIDAGNQAVAAVATASGDGKYRLVELPPGRYVLSNGSSFYPGSPHRADASIIDVSPGAKVEVNAWNLR